MQVKDKTHTKLYDSEWEVEYINDTTTHNNDNVNGIDSTFYYAFIMGYDLLYEELQASEHPECDNIYEYCCKISQEFLNSDYYKNTRLSGYEAFSDYIENNKFEILKSYDSFTGAEQKYYNNNLRVLEFGYRRNEPVALIEKFLGNKDKEYVIAINYTKDGDNLSWDRGFYFDDKIKAKKKFDSVLKGKSLYDKEELEV